MRGFELGWGEVAEGGVFAVGVVVALDVIEDFQCGRRRRLKAAALKHLAL